MPKIRRFLFQLLLAAMALVAAGPAQAEVGPWQEVPNGQVRLLSHSTAEGQDTALGIEVALDEGWKIYWEYAGPVGQPTLIEAADLAEGQTASFLFPVPKRDRLQGFSSYGYEGTVAFPGVLSGTAQGGVVRLGLSICSETQCIPHRTQLELPGQAVGDDLLVRQKLRTAFAKVPVPVEGMPTLALDKDAQEIGVTLPGEGAATDFYIAADGTAARAGFFLHEASLGPGGSLRAPYEVRESGQDLAFLGTPRVVTVGASGAEVYDLRDAVAHVALSGALGLDPNVASSVQSETSSSVQDGSEPPRSNLVVTAALLFIGGLLLNIMPCVLPVLFLKMKAAMIVDQGDRLTALRRSFGWTAVGMISTFVILGLVMSLVQQATGIQLTLGAWLQIPVTSIVLAALVTLFIANAFGWFEFVLPSSVLSLGAERQGVFGHILAGIVAALLGGACAGFLLAGALAVTFSLPPALMILMLGLMGLGLALPYVMVAFIPQAAQFVPKPGRWMLWLKPIIGIGLGVTLIYLIVISSQQIYPLAVVALAVIVGASLILLWKHRKQLGLGVLALMVLILPFFALPPDPVETARDYRAEIDALVADGERVLVDVTAFWCATCITNKAWVLDTNQMQTLFTETGTQIFTINADNPAENISEFMAEQGRSSLPLNILFSPAVPEGEILPSVLTKAAVREAVERTL